MVEWVERQGTAWRRARQLYAAGYTILVVQYSIDDPPEPLAVSGFDGVRWKKLPASAIPR